MAGLHDVQMKNNPFVRFADNPIDMQHKGDASAAHDHRHKDGGVQGIWMGTKVHCVVHIIHIFPALDTSWTGGASVGGPTTLTLYWDTTLHPNIKAV